jgi:tetratricopeptide (TPR) repeat protein
MALRMQRRCAQQLLSRFARSIWILSAVLASLLTSQASAQNSHEIALARALFEEGVALGDKGDWAGAADRFGRAYALKPTSGIAFNWASALSAIGKLTQAAELLEGVSRDPKAAPELKQDSEKKLAELAPRRPRLKLHIDPSIADESSVRVDGNAWPRAVWDVAVPIDPGAHVATASRGDQELARAEISLSEGEAGELSLGAAQPVQTEGAEAAASAGEREQARESERKPLYKNWILWTCVGAVALGGIVAAVVVTQRHGSESERPVVGNAGAGVIRW